MAVILETSATASLGLVGVDRKGLVIASAGMRRMIDAAAERAPVPGVDDVESQRRMAADGRVQASVRFQALKRTPATNSPARPVGVSGTRAPLQVTT